jgi:CHAT domain-containing protein
VETILYHADLVTLSGCQTKGGYPILGEGTLGLTRAFLLAGSRSVVSSLWDVEDEAASRFMDLFYAGLRQGLPRDESLRQARRRLAEEGVPPRDHAAFVLTGVGHEPVAAMAGATLHRGPARLGVPATVVAIVMVLGIVTFIRRR